jgi:hypothetical protein
MAVIAKVNHKTKLGAIQKALRKIAGKKNRPSQKTIADFYGALPNAFEDGLNYQKKATQ